MFWSIALLTIYYKAHIASTPINEARAVRSRTFFVVFQLFFIDTFNQSTFDWCLEHVHGDLVLIFYCSTTILSHTFRKVALIETHFDMLILTIRTNLVMITSKDLSSILGDWIISTNSTYLRLFSLGLLFERY
jgi:hypothetical protein